MVARNLKYVLCVFFRMISETSQKGSYYVKVFIAKVSIGTSEISPLTYRYQKTTPLVERQVIRDALERTLMGGGGGRGGGLAYAHAHTYSNQKTKETLT